MVNVAQESSLHYCILSVEEFTLDLVRFLEIDSVALRAF